MLDLLPQVFGVGTLTKEPELVKVGETEICNLRLAFNQSVGFGENKRVDAHYFDAVLWDTGAKAASEHLKKGDKMYFKGTLTQQRWVGKEDNLPKSKVVVRIGHFVPIPKPNKVEDSVVQEG